MRSCLIDLSDSLPDFAKDVDLLVISHNQPIPEGRPDRKKTLRWHDFGTALGGPAHEIHHSKRDRWQTFFVEQGGMWLRKDGERVQFWDNPPKYLLDIRNTEYPNGFFPGITAHKHVMLDNVWDDPSWLNTAFGLDLDPEEWKRWVHFALGYGSNWIPGEIWTNGRTTSPAVHGRMIENVRAAFPGRVHTAAGESSEVIAHCAADQAEGVAESIRDLPNVYLAVTDTEGHHKLTEWPEAWGPRP